MYEDQPTRLDTLGAPLRRIHTVAWAFAEVRDTENTSLGNGSASLCFALYTRRQYNGDRPGKRQTRREAGAQSHGPPMEEVAGPPKGECW